MTTVILIEVVCKRHITALC